MTVVSSVLLSGCQADKANTSAAAEEESLGQEESEEKAGTYPDFPTRFEKEKENVEFCCDVIISSDLKQQKLYEATANLCEVDWEKAFEELCSENEPYEVYENTEAENEYGEPVKMAAYVNEESGMGFSYGPYSSDLSYEKSKLQYYISSAFRLDDKFDDYNANLYSTETELNFSSREDVFEEITGFLKRIHADGMHL